MMPASIRRDLWRVARPLLLPVLAILLVGSLTQDWRLRLVVGVVVAIVIVWGFVATEGASGVASLSDALRGATFLVGLAVAVLLVATWVLAKYTDIADRTEFVDAYDVASAALVWAAFLLWGLAIAGRLTGFAVTPSRLVFVVVVAAVCVRYFAGLFVAGSTLSLGIVDHIVWGLLIVVVLVLTGRSEPAGQAPDPGWAVTARRYGLTAALLSGLAFMLASLLSIASDPPVGRDTLPFKEVAVWEHPDRVDPRISTAAQNRMRLAQRFSPLLEFPDDHRWEPIAVTDYLKHADLQLGDGTLSQRGPLTWKDLPTECDGGKRRACFRLTINCSLAQSEDSDCEGAETPDPGYVTDRGTAYVRFVDAKRLARDERARRFQVPAFASEVRLLAQYWLFYYYDDWRTRTLFGWLQQGHEADWEAITIGFSDSKPLFVGLSAHCGGTWLRWEDMRVADLPDDPLHPVVGVARGSQANYHDPSASTPPDNFARCAKVPSRRISVAGFAYDIRERMGVSTAVKLPHLERAESTTSPLRFAGVWGMHGEMSFETQFGRRYALPADQRGPASPPLQALWRDPMGTIFCESRKKWRYAGPRPGPKRCPKPSRIVKLSTPPAP